MARRTQQVNLRSGACQHGGRETEKEGERRRKRRIREDLDLDLFISGKFSKMPLALWVVTRQMFLTFRYNITASNISIRLTN